MNTNKLRWILYLIVFVIASTIAIQVYWNYKNYQTNKQQLINDVQVSLDNSVATYYENLTKKNTLGFVLNEGKTTDFFKGEGEFSAIIKKMDVKKDGTMVLDSIHPDSIKNITILRGFEADSLKRSINNKNNYFNLSDEKGKADFKKFKDSSVTGTFEDKNRRADFEFLTSQIIVSMTNDSLKVKEVDSLFKEELQRKKINLQHELFYYSSIEAKEFSETKNQTNKILSTASKSTFLPENSILKVYFKNETGVILKRIISGILISTLLVLAVIACLFYLLKIINQQKQLAEVKNDLISNITHEFKTPIATIGVALESIRDFKVIDDKEKTKKYINLSTSQLSKLNTMVEKLLETATLDSENLNLNKESVDLVELIENLVEKHQIHTYDKSLTFNASAESISTKADVFHFENAINNIVDNAIKYGGESISVSIKKNKKHIEINISDNGSTLTKQQAPQIFNKFYRVPKGNTHDVKGFGIGLYYTKKIVEKHNGNISVLLNNGTTFKISIPNE